MKLNDLLFRYYTKELENSSKTVYDLFDWKTVDVKIVDYSTNKIIIDMKNVEFPSHYSQSACDIIASKYFRKKGVPNDRGYEYSLKQVIHRMVSFWVEAAFDEGLIKEDKKQILYDELAFMMLNQMWAPNSPQWFNTGLKMAYDIDSPPQGHYYYDESKKDVVLSKDAYTRTQGSACFIVSVKDSLLGEKSLTDQLVTETRLFKYGSGVGSNWSSIRAKGEPLSGGGKSSGLLSFLKVFDRNAGAIKSGGTTRRAAKMNILDMSHPEIEDFIKWKAKEEDKVKALGKMGYSTHFDGEAYETVSGQNANNSVRISDDFMLSLSDKNAKWTLKGRVDSSINKDISVSKLWDDIASSAWKCGDPGVQFDDTINAWHTCPAGEDGKVNAKHNRINASNPCSEYMFLDDTACNLASINIVKYYDFENNSFDIDGYLHTIKMVQIVLEATIHWGQFPTKDIARKSYHFRTTGLGLTNLGALFMLMAKPYDSDEARNIAAALMSMLTGYSYYISSLFAKEIGSFTYFNINKKYMLRVIRNHARAANYSDTDKEFENLNYKPITIDHYLLTKEGYEDISKTLKQIWNNTIEFGEKYGFRNAQVSVLAPTGTIAFAMDCSTTSSEPFFSHVAYKKLVGGGSMEIINPIIPLTLKKLGYTKEQIDDIVKYVLRKEKKDGFDILVDGKIEGAPHLKEEHYPIFDTANKCGTGKRFIAPEGHVKMMGALTPHISGAISKTVNLPHDASIEDIKNIYLLSWKLGVKAIALYRDGCKASQPLNTSINKETDKKIEDLTYNELLEYVKTKHIEYKPIRIKPQGIRNAHVHEAEIGGLKLYITTSFYEDGRLGEIYVAAGRQGSLVKGLLDSLSTTISEMLQYGVPAKDIAKMYRGQKYEPSGFVARHPYIKSADSISDLISKIIDIELGDFSHCQVKPNQSEKEININTKNISNTQNKNREIIYGEVCPNCKSTKLVKNGTCKVCTECGTTTGCS
ncbi:vitamin B12-dependent ribonucleotide reductase [Defluviitalea phaphyphila]|uniref:vitamin B12-dependent ribonucleotide reductase n=1 Tax=Defluviitalea phaphyphila TaxID=1473580 RepID=UPI0007309ECA|nr:vitamin B12-dependent ribonucleotide reductase [Defluviitalea phaphyphila]